MLLGWGLAGSLVVEMSGYSSKVGGDGIVQFYRLGLNIFLKEIDLGKCFSSRVKKSLGTQARDTSTCVKFLIDATVCENSTT